MSTVPERRWRRLAEPLLAAALGVLLAALAFHPGLLSVDSAVQYAQARGALPLDDVHPPLMMLLWRVLDRVYEGPALLFLLFTAGGWLALAGLAWQGWHTRAARWTALMLLGLWPATFLVSAHLWKDVAMGVALLAAAAAILAWHRRAERRWQALAVLLLLLAAGFRHNALFAVLPLLAWLFWPLHGRRLAWALLCALVLAAWPALLNRAVGAIPVQPWSVVVLWDLAAISLDTGDVRVPPQLQRHPPLQLQTLREGYVPYANPPLYATGAVRLSFYEPLDEAERQLLLQTWWDAVRSHPRAYLAHRARLARYLLFGFPPEVPRELVYVPQRLTLEQAPLPLPAVDERGVIWRAAAALRSTPLFAGATYLLLALAAMVLAWRRSTAPLQGAVLALSLSAWCNALPLLLISGSAEFRYLAWSASASLLAFAFAAFGPRRDLG